MVGVSLVLALGHTLPLTQAIRIIPAGEVFAFLLCLSLPTAAHPCLPSKKSVQQAYFSLKHAFHYGD